MSSDLHHVRRSMETLTDLLQSIGLSLKGQDGPPVDLREPGTEEKSSVTKSRGSTIDCSSNQVNKPGQT